MNRQPLSAALAILMLGGSAARGAEWVRGGEDGRQPWWGVRGGLQFAIPPASHGPRGLVRVLYPTLPEGRYDLINFIAVEPIVGGRRGYSELEWSRLDRRQGKRFWVEPDQIAGTLARLEGGAEHLRVVVQVEEFDNGAKVRLVIEQRGDRPDEIALTLEALPGSAPLEYGILTATMGNKARARLLHLADETVSSLKLYAGYTGPNFAGPTTFPLKRLVITAQGDLLAALTSDETRPADVRPSPPNWYYGGFPVTQFWKMTQGTWRDDVHVAVNGRYTYWMSRRPIPGGIAFENFELRQRHQPGERFIFGITRRTPAELRGATTAPASAPAP
ncbi:MAG: hypothetical protein HRF43_20315 [Phycisphaerae bacterium]|jgi:hypothetical protein